MTLGRDGRKTAYLAEHLTFRSLLRDASPPPTLTFPRPDRLNCGWRAPECAALNPAQTATTCGPGPCRCAGRRAIGLAVQLPRTHPFLQDLQYRGKSITRHGSLRLRRRSDVCASRHRRNIRATVDLPATSARALALRQHRYRACRLISRFSVTVDQRTVFDQLRRVMGASDRPRIPQRPPAR